MANRDGVQTIVKDFANKVLGLIIGEMAKVARNSRLEVLRIIPGPQHVYVVVRLDKQCVTSRVLVDHMVGNDTNVRQYPKAALSIG